MRKALALTAALMITPSSAQVSMTPDMYEFEAPMTLACVDDFARMIEILANDYKEVPMLLAHMAQDTSLVYFVNESMTTSTLVVTRRTKDKEQACILWGGSDPSGGVWLVNPEPIFPKGEKS